MFFIRQSSKLLFGNSIVELRPVIPVGFLLVENILSS